MIQHNPKRWIAFLLTLMLLVGIAPRSYATEETMPETIPVTLPEVTEETTPETIPEPTTEATLVTTPEAAPEESHANSMLAATAYASTVGNVQLFDQASPNYTTYLNRQLSVTYRPNGTGSSKTAYIKNLGWHFARINGVSYPDDPIYCIEPNKNFAASTSGNYVDQGMTVSGSGSTHGADVWYAMPESYRRAIGLVLLYSEQRWDHSYSVLSTPMASNPNVPLRIATQFLIYEIVTGLRNADTFQQNGSNGYTDGDIFYNAGVDNVPYFAPHYNAIVESVQSAMKIPSFASRTSGTAPTITLTGEQTMVVDSNDVVSNFSFQDGNGAQFWTIGNQFYIQQTGNISASTVFKGTRYLPSADSSTFSVYYGGTSTYQTCVKLHSPSSANLTAYFKLKAPAAGNLAIQKTTEDGKNLSGWQFGIYSNSSCTNLLSGPHTTNSTGKITVSGLTRVIGGKVIKNTGQLPQVLIQNNHPGIVSRETFYAVQEEMKRRGAAKSPSAKSPTGRTSYTSRYALSERLVCGECGTLYRRCTWNIRGQKKIMWRCVSRLDYGKKYCHNSPSMEEGALQQAILNAINSRMSPKEELAEQITDAMRLEIAPSGGTASLGQIKNNIEALTQEFDRLLEQNSMASESERRFAEIARQLTKLRKQQEAVSSNLRSNAAERARANAIEKTLDQAEHRITQWSEEVIRQIVHTVRVISVDQIQVILYDGTQIDQQV